MKIVCGKSRSRRPVKESVSVIQLRMHVGVNQSGDNGGAKWLNYGYFKVEHEYLGQIGNGL